MLTYDQSLDFLYTQLPVFHRRGAPAYKPGTATAIALGEAFGNPHQAYPSIHIAGTNGKGSTAHTLAAVMQSAGFKVGLYTSPHLVDFRERIRINGQMISHEAVSSFVERYQALGLSLSPSFFELTMMMAFEWFREERVDIAVIETGLGGRLDSTNIITPCLSVITNISHDHTQFLGDTLPAIAAEKAGIIKQGVTVVVGESEGDVRRVFADKASQVGARVRYADSEQPFSRATPQAHGIIYADTPFGELCGELQGQCQPRNAATIITALTELRNQGWVIADKAVAEGFANVCRLTGLMGRWMQVSSEPLTICDTGHNSGGWSYLSRQLNEAPGHKYIVIGFVGDKDVSTILNMLPRHNVTYLFTQAAIDRAMPVDELARMAHSHGIDGKAYQSVALAYDAARNAALPGDTIFIGGSTFVVADFLSSITR